MTAGDLGTTVYAFSGSYVMNAAGTAKLVVQLQQVGQPAVPMPPTVGLPPNSGPTQLPAATLVPMTIGVGSYTDQEGVVHVAGTWASFVTTGTEFPVAGIYNTALSYEYDALGIAKRSPIVEYSVNP